MKTPKRRRSAKEIKYAWTCSTAFECEIGETEVRLYATEEQADCCYGKPRSKYDCYPVKVRVCLERRGKRNGKK